MSDPVDTDALRAWAVDARDVAAGSGSGLNLLLLCATNLGAAAAELDRLRTVIENAPHAYGISGYWCTAGLEVTPCTCWKADVL